MAPLSSFATFFAQVTNAVPAATGTGTFDPNAQGGPPAWTTFLYMLLIGGVWLLSILANKRQ